MKNEIPDNIPAIVGNKIKQSRLRHQLSQGELANLAKVSNNVLSRIESGKIKPTITTFVKLNQVLSEDWNYYFTDFDTLTKIKKIYTGGSKPPKTDFELIEEFHPEYLSAITDIINMYGQNIRSEKERESEKSGDEDE